MEDRPFRSVSLSNELLDEVDSLIKKKKDEVGEALLPSDFHSVAGFVAESVRLRLQGMKKRGV